MLLKIWSKLLCLKEKNHWDIWNSSEGEKKKLKLHKRINFPCCYQRDVFIKACGMLLYLRWNIVIQIMRFVVSSSYCLKLWL